MEMVCAPVYQTVIQMKVIAANNVPGKILHIASPTQVRIINIVTCRKVQCALKNTACIMTVSIR